MAAACLVLAAASRASAFCGCDKPPPPRANVRPFAAPVDQTITLFDDRLAQNGQYTVHFTARDSSSDWSRARAVVKRDFADGQLRRQLRVAVPNVSMGPSEISVYDHDDVLVYTLSDDQFTVIGEPIALHDFSETLTRDGYRTGVGADGTVYFALDMSEMSDATTYTGTALGVGFRFRPESVGMYNSQGFFGGGLDPQAPGLFQIAAGSGRVSDTLAYWRHEFRTYKEDHRKRDSRRSADGEWHADGTPHVDNYHLVVAVAATLDNGQPLPSGTSPAFRLVITSTPAPTSNL
ncbi:MAG: hypothetical protein ACREQL_15300 [Candidatus Binatia bacterium]